MGFLELLKKGYSLNKIPVLLLLVLAFTLLIVRMFIYSPWGQEGMNNGGLGIISQIIAMVLILIFVYFGYNLKRENFSDSEILKFSGIIGVFFAVIPYISIIDTPSGFFDNFPFPELLIPIIIGLPVIGGIMFGVLFSLIGKEIFKLHNKQSMPK